MAESKNTKNWADMDHDEEEEQEDIGLQGGKKEPTAAGTEEDKKDEGEAGQAGERPKRIKKDYGAAYDPNYKKNKWRKGGVPGSDKNMAPAIPRQKNERGDYVVTSFVIPERKEAAVKAGDKVCLLSLMSPFGS